MFIKSYITDDEFLIKNHNKLINKQIKFQHVKTFQIFIYTRAVHQLAIHFAALCVCRFGVPRIPELTLIPESHIFLAAMCT